MLQLLFGLRHLCFASLKRLAPIDLHQESLHYAQKHSLHLFLAITRLFFVFLQLFSRVAGCVFLVSRLQQRLESLIGSFGSVKLILLLLVNSFFAEVIEGKLSYASIHFSFLPIGLLELLLECLLRILELSGQLCLEQLVGLDLLVLGVNSTVELVKFPLHTFLLLLLSLIFLQIFLQFGIVTATLLLLASLNLPHLPLQQCDLRRVLILHLCNNLHL